MSYDWFYFGPGVSLPLRWCGTRVPLMGFVQARGAPHMGGGGRAGGAPPLGGMCGPWVPLPWVCAGPGCPSPPMRGRGRRLGAPPLRVLGLVVAPLSGGGPWCPSLGFLQAPSAPPVGEGGCGGLRVPLLWCWGGRGGEGAGPWVPLPLGWQMPWVA